MSPPPRCWIWQYPGAHDVIGDRAFGAEPHAVATLGRAMADGLLAAGLLPVVKHAPGHGRACVDSHLALPRVADADLSSDLLPFALNATLPWTMTAHIVYDAWDADLPATLSPAVIGDDHPLPHRVRGSPGDRRSGHAGAAGTPGRARRAGARGGLRPGAVLLRRRSRHRRPAGGLPPLAPAAADRLAAGSGACRTRRGGARGAGRCRAGRRTRRLLG